MTETVTEEEVWGIWNGVPERLIKRITKHVAVYENVEWRPSKPTGKVLATFKEAKEEAIRQAEQRIEVARRHISLDEQVIREWEAEKAALEQMTEPEG